MTITTIRELRETPVRYLTPDECRKLLSHSHPDGLSRERRDAYLLKAYVLPNGVSPHFGPADAAKIQEWTDQE